MKETGILHCFLSDKFENMQELKTDLVLDINFDFIQN